MEQQPITQAIRTHIERTNEMEHSSPIFLTSSFCFDNAEDMRAAFADETDDNIYSRFSNPSVQEFTDRMVSLEGAEAGYATSSGMSAVFASFMALLKSGDHLLSCNAIFGSTHTVISKYLPKYGIEHSYVAANDVASWEAAIRPNTKMIYLETPTNPGLEIIDLEAAGALAKKHNLILNVDNCFATPVAQRPIEYGAHLVVHSATKWIDGQGRVLGGVIVGKKGTDPRHLFILPQHWSGHVAVQCLGAFQKPRNTGCAHGATRQKCTCNCHGFGKPSKNRLAEIPVFKKPSTACHCRKANEKRRWYCLF